MSINKKLIQDTLLYAAGPVFNKLIAFVLIPLYSYCLAASELGYYDLVLTSTQLIAAVATLKISDGLYRWLIDHNEDPHYRTAAISNSFLVILGSILFILIIHYTVPLPGKRIYQHLISALIISTILLAHLFQLLRGFRLVKDYAYVSICNGLSLLVCNIVLLKIFHEGVRGVIGSLIISNTICILYITCRVRLWQFFNPNAVNRIFIKEMTKYSLPLVYNAVSWWLMSGFDRYLIAGFLGLEANGLYAISAKYAAVIILINSFFLPAWQDMVMKKSDALNISSQFTKMLNLYIILLFSLVILFTALSKIFTDHIIAPQYREAWKYIPILLTGNALLALTSFIGTLLMLEKNTYRIFTTSLLGSITNILISILLINAIGLYGPSLGMLGGFLTIFLIRYFYYKNRISIAIKLQPVLLLSLAFVCIIICLFFADTPLYYTSVFIAIMIFLVLNRKLGKELFHMAKHRLRPSKAVLHD